MVVVVLADEDAQALLDYFDTIRVHGVATSSKKAAVHVANAYEAIVRAQKTAKIADAQVRREEGG